MFKLAEARFFKLEVIQKSKPIKNLSKCLTLSLLKCFTLREMRKINLYDFVAVDFFSPTVFKGMLSADCSISSIDTFIGKVQMLHLTKVYRRRKKNNISHSQN